MHCFKCYQKENLYLTYIFQMIIFNTILLNIRLIMNNLYLMVHLSMINHTIRSDFYISYKFFVLLSLPSQILYQLYFSDLSVLTIPLSLTVLMESFHFSFHSSHLWFCFNTSLVFLKKL